MRSILTHRHIIALAAIATPTLASAQVTWQNPAGGAFHNGANWSSMAVPGATERVDFTLAGAYTVEFGANATNERLRVRAGHPTFNLSGSTYELTLSASVSVQIGLLSGDEAALTATGGLVSSQGMLIGAFGGSSGELIVTGPAAQWTSSAGVVVGDAGAGALRVLNGAQFTSGGTMILGRESGSDGFVEVTGDGSELVISQGALSIGPSTFGFLRDDADAPDPRGFFFSEGRVDLTPGATIVAPNVNIGPNGSLRGAGVINATSVSNNGGLLLARPGAPLRIEGQYFDTPGSTVEIEIGGVTPGVSHGVLDVAQQVVPDGNLLITLVNNYVPAPGASFTVVTCSAFGSLFNSIILPDLPSGREWAVQYSANSLTLLVEGDTHPADLNGDGRVNAQDLSILLGSWGVCPDPPAECIADINNDGRVNAQDLGELLSYWGVDIN